jgi:hypothetical protein
MLTDDGGRTGRRLLHDTEAYASLAESLGLAPDALERELAERAGYLAALEERGLCGPAEVAVAAGYYPDLPPQRSQGAGA